jgi:hypothetical protein
VRRRRTMGDTAPIATVDPTTLVSSPTNTIPVSTPSTATPNDLTTQLTPDQEAQIQTFVNQNMPFTPYVDYIVIGDEPPATLMTIDLSAYMSPTDYQNFSNNLTYMPRSQLEDWMNANIQPLVEPDYYLIVKKAIINLFNTVNLAYINQNGLAPWTWETQKTQSYYLSAQNPTIQAQAMLASFAPIPPTADQIAQTNIMAELAALQPLPHQALELSRQSAIKGLLALGEYAEAQAIIDAYKNADPATLQVLNSADQLNSVDLSTIPNPTPPPLGPVPIAGGSQLVVDNTGNNQIVGGGAT